MNRTILPLPPDPANHTSWQSYAAAQFKWAQQMKSRIETDSTVNTAPVAPFVTSLGTMTAVNTLTATDATSALLVTLINAMTQQGITAPTSQRTGP